MWWGVVTLFPEMFDAIKLHGITGRAIRSGQIVVECFNPRDYAPLPWRRVDDRPYGGGPGMVLKPEPLAAAIEAAKAAAPGPARVVYLSPQGQVLTQGALPKLLEAQQIIYVAGRYEGVDQRIIDTLVDEEWSIGDYILTGGELAAMVMIDALARLIPGVLGDDSSATQESFSEGLLEYPQYTRPPMFREIPVPEVLQSGDHQAIEAWRKDQALQQTVKKRPDLVARMINQSSDGLSASGVEAEE
ncbi:MAG: tRNA (guanosine(37)-N1)-methyltransferase TrmD [Pseudomonadota bacterium]